MTAWKYMKGSEKDFVGAPNDCVLIVKCNSNGMLYQLGDHHNVIAIEQCGDDIIAQREPVNECTLQDGVVFDAPIGVPINEFKCRQQSLNANDSDIRINGIPIGEFSAKAYVEVVKYDPTKADGEQRVKCGELKIDGEMHDATINKYTRDCKGVKVDVYDVLQAIGEIAMPSESPTHKRFARQPTAYIVTNNRGKRYLVFAGSTEYDNAVMFNYEMRALYE